MPQNSFAARRDRLLRQLKTAGVDALLVTSPYNVRYLTGFTGEDSNLVIGVNLTVLVSDSRFETQISQECPGLDVTIRTTSQTLTEAVAHVVAQSKLSVMGFESRTTTYSQWESLASAAKALQLIPQVDQVETLRQIKDADELAQIRQAIRQAERGFAVLKASICGDMSEQQAANELEQAMRRFVRAGEFRDDRCRRAKGCASPRTSNFDPHRGSELPVNRLGRDELPGLSQ